MARGYTRHGLAILHNGTRIATASNEPSAMTILSALVARAQAGDAGRCEVQEALIRDCVDPLRDHISNPRIEIRPNHIQHREQDEHACSCGLRWGVDEDDPHG